MLRPTMPGNAIVLGLLAWSCVARPPAVPRRGAQPVEHAVQEVPPAERCELWVSYQIAVEEIDGRPTDYRAQGSELYYCLVLAPGEHRLLLRLAYRSPLEFVRGETPVALTVQLAPGSATRLFDLEAGKKRGHVFTPWLASGAPADESLELRRR